MNDELKTIASLEFSKLVEVLTQELLEKKRTELDGLPGGGSQRMLKMRQIELQRSAKMCNGYADIWVSLLEGTNGGTLTREHVDFIKAQVQDVVATRKNSLLDAPNRLLSATGATDFNSRAVASDIVREIEGIEARIYRDLELRLRRQNVGLPKVRQLKGEPMSEPTVNLTVNAANLNLGSQVGEIKATLNVISQRGENEVASALRELSDAIVSSASLGDAQKQEGLQVLAEIARQAEAKPEARSPIGIVKSLIAGFPAAIRMAGDLTTLWDKYVPIIRHYFGI